MKLLVISDIHGLITGIDKMQEIINNLIIDKLIVLGDIYYSGIRNMLHEDYNPQYIEDFLRRNKDILICIKGNCDSSSDIKRNDFVNIKEIERITINDKELYFTHGHIYNERNWYKKDTVLIFGHYHVPFIRKIDSNYYVCIGSLSLPRDYKEPTYLLIDDNILTIYNLNGEIVEKVEI